MAQTLTYAVPLRFNDKLVPGSLVKVPLGKQEIWGVVMNDNELPGKWKMKEILEVESFYKFPELALKLIAWLAKYYQISENRVVDIALSRDWLKLCSGKLAPIYLGDSSQALLPLKDFQQETFQAFELRDRKKPTLLYGITGSGKTRIYQEIISQKPLNAKVLILVPEINLTPQTRQRIGAGLGRRVDLWHSSLGIRERRTTLQAILRNEHQILIGTRSSLLLPHAQIDLIIVDEEHDSSYKQQDPAPRYHARELALMTSQFTGADIILGSATPSLESWSMALSGKFNLLQMRNLAQGLGQVRWQIVDMKEQKSLQGERALSIPLRESLQKVVIAGRQAVLMLNRRGFSRAKVCSDCGEVQHCSDCQVPLVYHKSKNALICHYCSKVYRLYDPCSHCHSKNFVYDGLGIEQVEEEILEWIQGAKVLRLDRDTTSKKGATQHILDSFRKEEGNILLGTQMVAKGHDFPKVDLVGIVNADTGLQSPDFRANERNYQLLSQVAGRTGRHHGLNEECQIILQSWQPEHPLFQDVRKGNFSQFMKQEMESRRQVEFPPYMKLALVEVSSQFEERAKEAANLMMRGFTQKKALVQGMVYGPIEAPIAKIKKKHRVQIMLKCPFANQMIWWIDQITTQVEGHVHSSVILKWDLDPYSMI